MLDKVKHFFITNPPFVCPLSITENVVQQLEVCILDSANCVMKGQADINRYLPHILPMATVWDLKSVIFSKLGII
ncbi:MAG: hypothetical protein JFAIHJKO_02925 [Pyrinomonadaceae bacterium]|nr:hypothetical protein [Pyrinomonadaceae bacterium]